MKTGRQTARQAALWLGFIIVAFGLFVWWIEWKRPPNRMGHYRATTMSNLKQLAVGTKIYASEWDDRMPLDTSSAGKLVTALSPYVKPSFRQIRGIDEKFTSRNPVDHIVIGNPRLAAVLRSSIASPEATLYLFDRSAWPDGIRIASFVDTHVQAYPAERVEHAIGNAFVLPVMP